MTIANTGRSNSNNNSSTSSTTVVTSLPSNVAGNLIAVGVGWVDVGTTTATVTDSAGNTYISAHAKVTLANGYSIQMFIAFGIVASAGTNTITATFSTANAFADIHVTEENDSNGPWTSNPIDGAGSTGTGTSTALATGTVTPGQNNSQLITYGATNSGVLSAGAGGYTVRSTGANGIALGDLVQTTAAAKAGLLTSTISDVWGIIVIVIKPVTTLPFTPKGIVSAEKFGVPAFAPSGSAPISGTGIPSAERFGTPVVAATGTAPTAPKGIPSSEAFGTAAFTIVSAQNFAPTGIKSEEKFGTAAFGFISNQTIATVGIRSHEKFGIANFHQQMVATVRAIVPGLSKSSTLEIQPATQTQGAPPQEVINALIAGVVKIRRRAEIYLVDGVTPFDIPNWDSRLSSGSVDVDGTRDERRMVDLMLDNSDRALNLNPYNGFWYDKIIKTFWGIEYRGIGGLARWETQVGEFMIDNISEDRFPYLCHVTGRDYTKKCLISGITNSLTFTAGTPIETIITALAANSGVMKFRMPFTGYSYQDDVVFDTGTARWVIIKNVADTIGYEVYFTPDGYLTMRPYQDPTTSPLVFTFNTDKITGTLNDYKRQSDDSLIKNHCIVIGASVTDDAGITTTAFGEAINNDPSSPTSVGRLQSDRLDVFTSDVLTATADCQALAQTRLRVMGLDEFSIDFSSLVIPYIDANDIIDVTNSDEGDFVPTRFLFSNYKLQLGLGPMTGNAKRVVLAGSTAGSS